MHGRHLVLEIGIAHDQPLEAERILLAVELGARALRDRLDEFLHLVLDAHELAGRERLEDDPGDAGGRQVQVDLERHSRGREREQPLFGRAFQLLATEEDVSQTHRRPSLPTGTRRVLVVYFQTE